MNSDLPHADSVPQASGEVLARSDPECRWENEGGHLRSSHGLFEAASQFVEALARQRLAEEHALLLNQVAARADAVLEAGAAGRWPTRELADLIAYLRSELIGQTRTEESLLFTGADTDSGEAFGRLARDHVRLRYALEALADAGSAQGSRGPEALAATVRGLVTQLTAHLSREAAILPHYATSVGWRQAMAAMEQHPHAWYPLTHAPVIDLDAFSAPQVIDAVTRRVQQLRPGEYVELIGSTDPQQLCRRLLRDRDIAAQYVTNGPKTWRVAVTRRARE